MLFCIKLIEQIMGYPLRGYLAVVTWIYFDDISAVMVTGQSNDLTLAPMTMP